MRIAGLLNRLLTSSAIRAMEAFRPLAALLALAAVTGCDKAAPSASVVPPAAPPRSAATAVATIENASFVGAAACIRCHEAESHDWEGSHHDLAMQEATEATVLGDFNDTAFTYHEVTSTFYRKDGAFYARTDGPDGALHDYPIAYTFGVYPLQQYLIRFPDGRLQALNVCWDTRSVKDGGQRWFHLYPDENVRFDDVLHWTGPYQNWNHMCAECHSTNVRKHYDPDKDVFATSWSEIDVSCETCHGPASRHVQWADSQKAGPEHVDKGDKGLVVQFKDDERADWFFDTTTGIAKRERPRTNHAEVEACARCHSRRGTFSEEHTPGKPLADTHRLALLERALYEPDGQIKDEVYEYGSFLQSKMYAAGVTCTDCHNPHSLRVAGENMTCARCHLSTKFDVPEHHKHAQGTDAAKCVSCHAPTKNYMVVHARHDHSFRVPRPDLTLKIGSPNACNGCHADKSAQWAADAAVKWWGDKRAAMPHYGVALDAGRRSLPGSPTALLGLIDDATQPPIVRASALEFLADATSTSAIGSIIRSLGDADPQVRAAAARALQNRSDQTPAQLGRDLTPLLSDPVRQVRMDAARTLAATRDVPLTKEARAAFERALDEYRLAEGINADRPESRMNLGVLALDRGDPETAEREYLAGIRVAPRFGAPYVNLADLYRAQDREQATEQTLRQGLAMAPNDAGLRHALGLSLVRQKRLAEALVELRLASELNPENPRYPYVYAVALDAAGQREEAMLVLRGTDKRHPGDVDVLAALATYSADAGRFTDALAYADRLVALTPTDRSSIEFRDQLRARAASKSR
jgi:Flp pilus assembly protein TadD/nitrate/TMAO reductase-like tetraheme cytochrome c subunit